MKWKGTVSHSGQSAMAARLATAKAPQATSTTGGSRSGHSTRSTHRKLVPPSAYGRDGLVAKLRPQSAHVDVDHVGSGLEVVPPHRGEQSLFRQHDTRAAHQLPQ